MSKRHSIQFKITRSTILCFVMGMLILLLILFFYLHHAFNGIAEDTAKTQGEKYANMLQGQFENLISFLSGVSGIVETQIESGDTDRIGLQKRIFHAFEGYESAEGMGLLMEPNAYDGADGAYIGTNYGTKRSGRISFYYYTDNGKTAYRSQVDEDDKEFTKDYYVKPK